MVIHALNMQECDYDVPIAGQLEISEYQGNVTKETMAVANLFKANINLALPIIIVQVNRRESVYT